MAVRKKALVLLFLVVAEDVNGSGRDCGTIPRMDTIEKPFLRSILAISSGVRKRDQSCVPRHRCDIIIDVKTGGESGNSTVPPTVGKYSDQPLGRHNSHEIRF